jgi:hypothetical protein
MEKMYFSNPVFNAGKNLTVRRGIKWNLHDSQQVIIYDVNIPKALYFDVVIKTKVMRFCDLEDQMLVDEHDPLGRTYFSLFAEMYKIYPEFDAREIVTLVYFDLGCKK